jgi:hypothetical protein
MNLQEVYKFIKKHPYFISLAFVFVFYICFPTNNSSQDGYFYAGHVAYNESLFWPHHFLHSPLIFLINGLLKVVGITIDILALSKMVNSVFAIVNLVILKNFLEYLNVSKKEIILYLFVLGFSFSLWRYGTENETYIIPSTFSLLGSFYLLKFTHFTKNKYLFLSGFFMTISCLFHQLYIFWWAGLLVSSFLHKKSIKTVFIYSVSFVLVLIAYVLALVFYEKETLTFENLMHFVLQEFYGGTVGTDFGWKGIFFQVVNTFRTFFQVHPTIYYLIQKSFIFCIPLLLGGYLFYQFFSKVRKKELLQKKKHSESLFVKTHIIIAIVVYLFAYYNMGNVEFMISLPYILVLCLAILFKLNNQFLQTLAITLFIWNFTYGIGPNYFLKYYNDDVLVNYMIENPKESYIIKNNFTRNNYFYKTGIYNPDNIKHYMNTSIVLEELFKETDCIYTDLIDKPTILNKETVVIEENLSVLFEKYTTTKILSYDGFYGTSTIYKVCK